MASRRGKRKKKLTSGPNLMWHAMVAKPPHKTTSRGHLNGIA
jgi:hypothetical protein